MDKRNQKWVIFIFAALFVCAVAAGFLPDIKGHAKITPAKDCVAVIRIDGAIYGGPQEDSVFAAATGAASEQIMYELEQARKDSRVKAVLLRINSPGGSTGATQEIAEEMDKIKSAGKPIIISMGDMCASAGYWLASKGDYVFANPATLTGSIGVYIDYTNMEELMDKLGIKNQKIKSGAHKDILSMYRPMTDEETAMIQKMVDDIYMQFIKTVSDGRHIELEKVRSFADGRILTGQQAMDIGLVDAMGNYYDALNYAAGRAGIEGENIPVKKYSAGKSLRNIFNGEAESILKTVSQGVAHEILGVMSKEPLPAIR